MTGTAPKKLIVCLDGTNNQIGAALPTNVGKTFEMLSLTQPGRQLAYYDPGVGTLPASTARGKVGRLMSRAAELVFGWGLKANVAQAYTWLMQHYQFRDEIYVFGFSRGAYTARALVGMLNRPGLLRPGSENLVEYAVQEYATSKPVDDRRKDGIREFADAFCWGTSNDQLTREWNDEHHAGWHAVPINYLGVWDTVEATGLGPFGRLNWPYTHELYNVQRGRHAVSIDEHRRPYREFLVQPGCKVEEAWFAGVHCDVGGTFDNCDLASIALKWVLDDVVGDLLLREPDSYSAQCSVQPDFALAEIHKMEWLWNLAGRHSRTIPDGANLHASVRDRMAKCSTPYRPKLPANYGFIDETWPTQIPADDLHIAPQTPQPLPRQPQQPATRTATAGPAPAHEA